MRTLAWAGLCASPLLLFCYLASRHVDRNAHRPVPAALTFSAATARHWLREDHEQGAFGAAQRDTSRAAQQSRSMSCDSSPARATTMLQPIAITDSP